MPTTRQALTRLLLLALPCLSLRCNGPICDSCPEPPCVGVYSGGISLRPLSAQWLPTPAPDSLRFINSNGSLARLHLLPPAGADSVALPAFAGLSAQYDEAYQYPSYVPCGPYFRAKRVVQHYQGRNIGLDLDFQLVKNLSAAPAPTNSSVALTRAVADTLPDVLVLTFNHQYYADFPVVGAPFRQPRAMRYGEAVYLDSVQLAGHRFFGVYQFTRRTFSAAIEPRRFFFRPGQGLVGFTYTNNEEWARL